MTAPSVVRLARPEDHTEIWRLLLQSHREQGRFAVAPEKVEYFISRALFPQMIPEWDTGPRGVIGVIGDIGALEALCFVTIGTFWYSNDRHLEEFIVYVDPECRRSFHARALIKWMKGQSERTGLPLICGVFATVRTQAKVDLYNRMLPKTGEFFFYDGKSDVTAATVSSASSQVA